MKTINTLKAFAAATILSLSFNAIATANPVESDSNSSAQSSLYTVATRSDDVSANDYDLWNITLDAHESYLIVVEGDGDTDLDLYIYDENGNEIDKDIDDTDYCICEVTPRWTGKFKIKIKNYGSVYNHYNLRIYRED
jgi:uncharacterized protein YdeI (BOF family)